jgi:class 3 adenylate cyclase
VNLAARIESHTKIAGCPILIDEETCIRLQESIPVNPLGEILFKGKTVPVKIYSVAT